MGRQACKFFRIGTCIRGSKCWYAHDDPPKSNGNNNSSRQRPTASDASPSFSSSHRGSASTSSSFGRNNTTSSYNNSSSRGHSGGSPSFSRTASNTNGRSSSVVSSSSESNRSSGGNNNSRYPAATSSSSRINNSSSRSTFTPSSSTTTIFGTGSSRPHAASTNNSSQRTSSFSSSGTARSSSHRSSADARAASSGASATANDGAKSALPAKQEPEASATTSGKAVEIATAAGATADGKTDDPSSLSAWDGGAWGEAFLEGVAKCEGTSGKKIYLYGISSNRCPECRHRVKLENDVCENCETRHQRARTCKMCALVKPSMLCYECDAFFCEACYTKPHVLDFAATVKSIFRMRVSEKIALGEKVSISVDEKPTKAAARGPKANSDSSAAPVNPFQAAAAAAAAAAQPPNQQQQQLSGEGENGRALRVGSNQSEPIVVDEAVSSAPGTAASSASSGESASEISRAAASAAKAELDSPSRKRKLSETTPGGAQPSLFEKVRLMHEQKARLAHQRQQHEQQLQDKRRTQELEQEQQRRLQDLQLLRERQQAQQMQQRVERQQESFLDRQHQQQHETLQQRQQRQLEQQQRLQQQQKLHQLVSFSTQQTASPSAGSVVTTLSPSPAAASALTVASEQLGSQTGATTTTSTTLVVAEASSGAAHQPPSPGIHFPPPQHFQPPQVQQQQQQLHLQLEQRREHLQQVVSVPPSPSEGNTYQLGGAAGFTPPVTPFPTAGGSVAGAALPSVSSAVVDLSGPQDSAIVSVQPPGSSYADASSNMDDPLKFAVVQEYDHVNSYALQLEASNAKLNERVRQISMQNVTTAARLNDQIKVYRTTLDQVYERRFEALAKVIMFSPDVRSRVKKIDHTTLGDIPHVLTACNLKCAQLAASIKTRESNVQNLRNAIDVAISSGDPEKLAQLHLLGKQISSHEQKIASQRTERDDQFVLMIQYSRKLREVVRTQAVQNAKAKAGAKQPPPQEQQ